MAEDQFGPICIRDTLLTAKMWTNEGAIARFRIRNDWHWAVMEISSWDLDWGDGTIPDWPYWGYEELTYQQERVISHRYIQPGIYSFVFTWVGGLRRIADRRYVRPDGQAGVCSHEEVRLQVEVRPTYDLQIGDNDAAFRWAGAIRSAAAGDVVPAPGEKGFVEQLQDELHVLGFRLLHNNDGVFGRQTAWAVREFQIYASMNAVAKEATAPAGRYVDRLYQVANPRVYNGPISGVLDATTRRTLYYWSVNSLRCPVVVDAVNPATGVATIENIWLKDDAQNPADRMMVRDFSNYYTLPVGRLQNVPVTLGDYSAAGHGGPSSRAPTHTWPEAELLPEHLTGSTLANLTADELSTYKAIRAVSEVECMGFFDSLTAWDRAIMSLGPCHWTLGLANQAGVVAEGELCGYLAYLRSTEPADFERAIRFFGVQADESWVSAATGIADGADLFDANQRKFAGWIAQQNVNGAFVRTPATIDDANYFRTWHWFYRFVMAGRTVAGFRARMWDMARIRLRDILSTPWGAGPPAVQNVPGNGGAMRPPTVGDVFTSEKACALLLRWHVYLPGHVVFGGNSGPQIRNALALAAIPNIAGNPTQWNDGHEQALINAIMQQVGLINNQQLTNTMTEVRDWHIWGVGGGPRNYTLPHTINNLSQNRNSFQLNVAGLPPPPP